MKKIKIIITVFLVITILVAGYYLYTQQRHEEEVIEETTQEIDETPPSISQVLVSDITEKSACITWITDEPSDSQVEYGISESYGRTTSLSLEFITSHSMTLSRLEPDNTYYFKVKSKDTAGNEATASGNFSTQPAPLVGLQAPGLEDVIVNTICLDVEQSYPGSEKKSSLSIYKSTKSILSRLGVKLVDEGDPCDATLTIILTGNALRANYWKAGTCYSGAVAYIDISLTIPEREPFTFHTSERYPPPNTIFYCPKEPSGAPFREVCFNALGDSLATLWGPQVFIKIMSMEEGWPSYSAKSLIEIGEPVVELLIQTLKDEDSNVRARAAYALGEIGDERAIEALTNALKDKDLGVQEIVKRALEKIEEKKSSQ